MHFQGMILGKTTYSSGFSQTEWHRCGLHTNFILFSELRLTDNVLGVSLAHCMFNVPLAIWILEGFMSSMPKQIDETAFIDGMDFLDSLERYFCL